MDGPENDHSKGFGPTKRAADYEVYKAQALTFGLKVGGDVYYTIPDVADDGMSCSRIVRKWDCASMKEAEEVPVDSV
jgi:hypothetical protein